MTSQTNRELNLLEKITAPAAPTNQCDTFGSETVDEMLEGRDAELRACWLALGGLLETAQQGPVSGRQNDAISLQPARAALTPLASGGGTPPEASLRGNTASRRSRQGEIPQWKLFASAGSLLAALAFGSLLLPPMRLPTATNFPVANAELGETGAGVLPEADAGVDLAWDSPLDASITSAERAVWSLGSDSPAAEQSFRWADYQIQQMEESFRGNSL